MAAKPVVDGIDRQHQGELTVIHLNVQDAISQPLMQKYGFEYTPTFVLIDAQGGLLFTRVGAIDPGEVSQELAAH